MSVLARCFVRARAVRSFAIAAQNVAQPAADASLNWALAKAGVIPKAHAFRNLSAQQLAKHEGTVERTVPVFLWLLESSTYRSCDCLFFVSFFAVFKFFICILLYYCFQARQSPSRSR